MIVTAAIGFYAAQQDMNVQYICYFGVMSLVKGIFDLVACIDFCVKITKIVPIFSSKMPMIENVTHLTIIACPVVSFLGAAIAYVVYNDYTSLAPAPMDDDRDFGPGRPILQSRQPTRREDEETGTTSQRYSTFQPFAGTGQRLGSN